MTALSVIVPIYNVERYLPECLDSILGQDFSDLELIAVDDCSPDGSAAILERYAAADNRVRIVRPERNVGLGLARNAGLDVARGDYIWFVDSDDYLFPDAIATAMARVMEQDADVAVVGWVRDYEDGRRVPGTARHLLATAPAHFDVASWPAILNVLHVAWNKVIRRDLFERHGLRFDVGWYEDVSFTYPLLTAASRITTVAIPCVSYRQRESGSITATPSERHCEIFDHWARAQHLLDEQGGVCANVRSHIFRKMLTHYLQVLFKPNRVPPGTKRKFVTKMREHYHRFLPQGGLRPAGFLERVRHRLIAAGSLNGLRLEAWARRRSRSIARRLSRP